MVLLSFHDILWWGYFNYIHVMSTTTTNNTYQSTENDEPKPLDNRAPEICITNMIITQY